CTRRPDETHPGGRAICRLPRLASSITMKRSIGAMGFLALIAVGAHAAEDKTAADLAKLPPAVARVIDFKKDVQPIFAKACLSCHGPAKQKSGLRLDEAAAALKGGDSGPVIKPGEATQSRLLQVVAGLDAEVKMPSEGKSLTRDEIAV